MLRSLVGALVGSSLAGWRLWTATATGRRRGGVCRRGGPARPPKPKERLISELKKPVDQAGQLVPAYPLEEVFCLDVECLAVGKSHLKDDREPCCLALVDSNGTVLLRRLIRPTRPVVSYLTPYTGVREGDLDEGGAAVSLAEAVAELRATLSPRAVLVGQNPEGDVEWMQLRQGVDFKEIVDLADVFRDKYGRVFSLRHAAYVLLGKRASPTSHDALWDACSSVELYKKALSVSPEELARLRRKMTAVEYWPPKASLAKKFNFQIDGVCLSMYNSRGCICGKPCLSFS